ncbi:MAG: hypothetical protein ACFBSF_15215 [Leptolyngbyaceae cyanobacterium]
MSNPVGDQMSQSWGLRDIDYVIRSTVESVKLRAKLQNLAVSQSP